EPTADVWPHLAVAIPVEQLPEERSVAGRVDDRRRAVRDAHDRDRLEDRLVERDRRHLTAGEPDDEVAAVPRHAPQQVAHVGPADRVEQSIDTTAVGELLHDRSERVDLTVVDDVISAELSAELDLLGSPRDGDDRRAERLRDLDRGGPAPAGRARDEHGLTALHVAALHQRVTG